MTKIATLCLVINNGKILLMRKKRGFGEGKIVAPGGHVEDGEALHEAAAREVFEETGIKPLNVEKYGELRFYFGQKDEPDWIVHVFLAENFEGSEKETAEGIPKWYDKDKLPYEEMWIDDIHWVPLMLEGKKFTARFVFDKDVKNILEYEINETGLVV